MSGIQLYLRGEQAGLRDGAILQKQNDRQITSHSLPISKETAFPQNKKNGLLPGYFGNQGGFVVFGLFLLLLLFLWLLSFIYCDT